MNIITQQILLRKAKATLTAILLFSFAAMTYSAQADTPIACSAAVTQTNNALQASGNKTISDEKGLATLLQVLNQDDVLPSSYVTTSKAKQLGWNGEDSSSLWGIWALNKKLIGGDPIQNAALPNNSRWYSADIESVRGFRSVKRLIYTPTDPTRYLTTNAYKSMVKIPACQ